jgi:archaellum component FlaC
MGRDIKAELTTAQQQVKALGATREKLAGDARFEESRVNQAVDQLKGLGVENAATLSVEELIALRDKTQTEMITNLDALQEQIRKGQAITAEYEAATK